MSKNNKLLTLKLIATRTNIRENSQESKQLAALIRQINQMGRRNRAKAYQLEPDPPLAA
ncbi:MAG: hypothetical protein FD167_2801 [bacterium]|nr:MAG: hypothetical protein FD167_2801 [bacterium]